MKMERRKVRDFGERLEVQVLIQMLIDVFSDSMHAIDIDIAALGRTARHRECESVFRLVADGFDIVAMRADNVIDDHDVYFGTLALA